MDRLIINAVQLRRGAAVSQVSTAKRAYLTDRISLSLSYIQQQKRIGEGTGVRAVGVRELRVSNCETRDRLWGEKF
ncbi:hypothetical protein EGR_00489 [Echinococcus granulosus]|uniref:Uncharacterized protein n=1 Tax=Echinococcus granulosus TaxID=6210 RepID=W6VCE1_ECHGR|nr:hypothetical protein EGR_00489 [Echinococcus granulosus]EUB64539.1 hypothetical protein EGR_00489 [Echinococcus granulosus]